ncbi:unnamed protein product, partial [Polarella glacialis]
ALDRHYVKRAEYKATVEDKLATLLAHQVLRAETLEKQVSDTVAGQAEHALLIERVSAKLDEEVSSLTPQVIAIKEWLKRLDDREEDRYKEFLQAVQGLEAETVRRDEAQHQSLKALEARLAREEAARQDLGSDVQKVQDFLASDQLKDHVVITCDNALRNYVSKDEMVRELATAADFMVSPVREELARVERELAERTEALENKARSLDREIYEADQRLQAADKELDKKLLELTAEVDTKAPMLHVKEREQELDKRLSKIEGNHDALSQKSTHKIEEVVTRLSEFQVIMQDHEHALEHHAEELNNRATKYDITVCREKIEHCALRERVEKELKDIKSTLSWQSSKLEGQAFGQSFGAGGGGMSLLSSRTGRSRLSRAPSTASSFRAPSPAVSFVPSPAVSLGPQQRSSFSLLDNALVDIDLATIDDAANGKNEADQKSDHQQPTKNGESADGAEAGDLAALGEPAELGEGEEYEEDDEEDQMLMQQQQMMQFLQMHQQQQQQEQGPVAGASEILSLVQQQLECLAQAVMSLGRACLRPPTGKAGGTAATSLAGLAGLPRDARQDYGTELLHHTSSVLYWITNRRAPIDWEPSRLTTMALTALPGPGSGGGSGGWAAASPSPPARNEEFPGPQSPGLGPGPSPGSSNSPRRPHTSPEAPGSAPGSGFRRAHRGLRATGPGNKVDTKPGGRAFPSGGSDWQFRGMSNKDYRGQAAARILAPPPVHHEVALEIAGGGICRGSATSEIFGVGLLHSAASSVMQIVGETEALSPSPSSPRTIAGPGPQSRLTPKSVGGLASPPPSCRAGTPVDGATSILPGARGVDLRDVQSSLRSMWQSEGDASFLQASSPGSSVVLPPLAAAGAVEKADKTPTQEERLQSAINSSRSSPRGIISPSHSFFPSRNTPTPVPEELPDQPSLGHEEDGD